MSSKILEYARLLRLPGLGGLSIAPVFGALSVGVFDIYKLSILFLIGAFASIYGFVLNDYIDVDVDKRSKELSMRPLVKGTVSKQAALFICIFCFIATLVTIFIVFFTNQPSFYYGLLCIVASAGLGTFYNLYGKRIIGSDFIVALSEAFLVLFAAFIVLPLDGTFTIFTYLVFLLTFNQLVYENAVSGGIKDADHDPLMNVKNIALTSGVSVTPTQQLIIPKTFVTFGLGIRIMSMIFIFTPMLFYKNIYQYELCNIVFMIIFAIGVFILSIKLLRLKQFNRNRIRKLITGQTFLRYSLVPLMLIPLVGIHTTLVLILLPFLWYLSFTPLVKGKLFKPEM